MAQIAKSYRIFMSESSKHHQFKDFIFLFLSQWKINCFKQIYLNVKDLDPRSIYQTLGEFIKVVIFPNQICYHCLEFSKQV